MGVKVHYLHSEIETLERVEILRDLRLGVYDVVVGINLLREGLDLPEVSLVAILDADKEGFLRSEWSLIQTIGRAARHVDGHGHHVRRHDDRLHAPRHRRDEPAPPHPAGLQRGARHHAAGHPQGHPRPDRPRAQGGRGAGRVPHGRRIPKDEIARLVKDLESQMKAAAKNLEFEKAALLRDQIVELRRELVGDEEGLKELAAMRQASGGPSEGARRSAGRPHGRWRRR